MPNQKNATLLTARGMGTNATSLTHTIICYSAIVFFTMVSNRTYFITRNLGHDGTEPLQSLSFFSEACHPRPSLSDLNMHSRYNIEGPEEVTGLTGIVTLALNCIVNTPAENGER